MAKNNALQKPFAVMILVFVVITAIGFLLQNQLEGKKVDTDVVLGGNLILFLLSLFTLRRSAAAINDPNPHAFVTSYYAGFLIRLAGVAAAAFFYIYSMQGNVTKESVFVFMGLYAIYSMIEVSTLRKMLKEKKNG